MYRNLLLNNLTALVLLLFVANNIYAQGTEVISAKIGFGYQYTGGGSNNPDWNMTRPNMDPIGMMEELCQSQRGVDLIDLGLPPNGQYIGWCLTSDDGHVYRCDGDGDPATADDRCASWSATDCSPGAPYSLDCGLVVDNDCEDLIANPCDVGTGNKKASVPLFKAGSLSMTLSYNSFDVSFPNQIGFRWTSNFHKQLYVNHDIAHFIDGAGKGETWIKSNGIWVVNSDSDLDLIDTINGYLINNQKDEKFYFEVNPTTEIFLVAKEEDAQGNVILYDYSNLNSGQYEYLIVSDHYGNSIEIKNSSYVIDPSGNFYKFVAPQSTSRLTEIWYPDETISDSDNPKKIFHYENTNFPYLLTGITDENGDRYATYAYDTDGNAIISEHAQTTNAVNQEKYEFDYQGAN